MQFNTENPVVAAQERRNQRTLQMLPVASNLEQRQYQRQREETDRRHLFDAAQIMAERSAPPDVQTTMPVVPEQPAAPPQPQMSPAGAGEFGSEPSIMKTIPQQQNPLAAVRAQGDVQAERLRRAVAVGPAAAKVYGPMLAKHDEGQRASMQKHSDAVLAKLGDGDVEGARQYANVYGLRHLDSLFNNPRALMTVSSVSKLAKNLGLRDTHASAFVSTVMDSMQKGMSYEQAVQAAHSKVADVAGAEPSGPPIATSKGYVQRTKGGKADYVKDPEGNVAMPPDRLLQHRPGGAGGESRQTQHAEAKKKALMAVGWSEKDATEAAYGNAGARKISERDVAAVAKSLWATDQKQLLRKDRKFASFDDAMKAARSSLGVGGGGAPSPSPAPGPRASQGDARRAELPGGRPADPLPRKADGKVDRARLVHGQIYDLGEKGQGRYNSQLQQFE